MDTKQPNGYLSAPVPVWRIGNLHILALIGGALIPVVVLHPLGEIAGMAVSRLLSGWTWAHFTGAIIANFTLLYLSLIGWRHLRVKLFSYELTRTLTNPDLIVTEATFKRLSKELHDVLPHYVRTTTNIVFDTRHLPQVVEGEQFLVASPCIASITFELAPHLEGYQDVVLRPGLLLTVSKVYEDAAFAFTCAPENIAQFISENVPDQITKSDNFSGYASITIFRYHIGNELMRST